MKRINFKKFDILQIISAVLCVVLLFGIVSFFAFSFNNEMKDISSTAFEIGALSDQGKYIKSDKHLYTEEFFECQGLTVEVEFDSYVSYEVFYYREDKSFIGSTGNLVDSYEKGTAFTNAKYARVVMMPVLNDGDTKLTFLNKFIYSNDIKVKVLKDQIFEAPLAAIDSSIRSKYSVEVDNVIYCASIFADGPFVPGNMAEYSGKTIRRISIPVAGVMDHTKDSVFSVYVFSGNGNSSFKKVQEYELIIPAYTFTSSLPEYVINENEVNDGRNAKWFSFDVNIKLEAGQVLGFSDASDTVSWIYRKGFTAENNHFGFYNCALTTPNPMKDLSVYFDVEYLE